jgi:hypothetical protein
MEYSGSRASNQYTTTNSTLIKERQEARERRMASMKLSLAVVFLLSGKLLAS